MTWEELNGASKIKDAPKSGIMLIYARDGVIFERYQSLQEVGKRVNGKELLEVHLFDGEREYRALSSQSKRFTAHFIDNVFIAEKKDEDSIYSQDILLETGEENKTGINKIRVDNHILYNDTGMALIDNYRLVEVR